MREYRWNEISGLRFREERLYEMNQVMGKFVERIGFWSYIQILGRPWFGVQTQNVQSVIECVLGTLHV
jgi:hypothetical protein